MDGPEALAKLEGDSFDLIVTDYHMLGMNGLEVGRAGLLAGHQPADGARPLLATSWASYNWPTAPRQRCTPSKRALSTWTSFDAEEEIL